MGTGMGRISKILEEVTTITMACPHRLLIVWSCLLYNWFIHSWNMWNTSIYSWKENTSKMYKFIFSIWIIVATQVDNTKMNTITHNLLKFQCIYSTKWITSINININISISINIITNINININITIIILITILLLIFFNCSFKTSTFSIYTPPSLLH